MNDESSFVARAATQVWPVEHDTEADAVVTWNLSDFPATALDAHGIALWTPDMLIMRLLAERQEAVMEVMRRHRASLRNPPRTAVDYLETLLAQGLKESVAMLKAHEGEI